MHWPDAPFYIEIYKGILVASEKFSGKPEAAIARGETLLSTTNGRALLILDENRNELYRLNRIPLETDTNDS